MAACSLMIFITYGLIYSYSVFFKPLAGYFQWDRATVSLIYSLSVIIRGAAAIGTGWLADKFGARKIMLVSGILMGAGFLLSSRVSALWHFFIAYGIIESIGMSGVFGIVTAMVSRWFTKNRGLALGIVASGSGLGTLLLIPGSERLINAVDWSQSFFIIGIAAGALMIFAALFLREPPDTPPVEGTKKAPSDGIPFRVAIRDSRLLLITAMFFLFFFGIQIVMVHLVNYATDVGIQPLVAATFISLIGAVSIASRLSIGVIAERIGLYKSLVLLCVSLAVSFTLLIFTRSVWSFYLFAVVFGIPYGGEVTQIPLVIGRFFGTRAMATIMGVTVFVISLGGALGSWVAGAIYDYMRSYNGAFIAGAAAAICVMGIIWLLKKQDSQKESGSTATVI
ncbi:MAG: MFS transporter [Dehalococcoidales bacterium]|nr:MFS transporter [Dehalococcoidales bacterium]